VRDALPKNEETEPFQVNALSRNTKSMGEAMMELLALSVSVAVLGGIWAFISDRDDPINEIIAQPMPSRCL